MGVFPKKKKLCQMATLKAINGERKSQSYKTDGVINFPSFHLVCLWAMMLII